MKRVFTFLLTSLVFLHAAVAAPTDLPMMTSDMENPVYYTISNTRSTSGKYLYYAGDNVGLKDSDSITTASLFFFTGSADACYIHNAATDKKVASVTSWTDEGAEWTIMATPYGDGTTGLSIGPWDDPQGGRCWNEFTHNDAYTTWMANDAGSIFVMELYGDVDIDITAGIEELLAANADNHAAVPALGQYATAAYEALALAKDSVTTLSQANEAIAAFEASKCLPVFTIDGVINYAAGKSIYMDGTSLYFKETDRADRSMLWTFDMTDTIVGVTDKVVVKNLATGKLFWNSPYIKVTETSDAVADDGIFLFYTKGNDTPVHAQHAGQMITRWAATESTSGSAWKFVYAGTTYGINELPEVPDTPVVPDTPEGVVNDLASADPTKCYTISTNGRGGWAVDAAGTLFTCTMAEGLTVDESDPRQQFVILSLNAQDYYLYSVSAKKFVKKDGSLVAGVADAIEFVDASSVGAGRVMVRFDENHNINISDVSRRMEINTWNTLNGGNAVAIIEAGDFDATEALAMLAHTPEDAVKMSIEFKQDATTGWIEGAEWYSEEDRIIAFNSPTYRFTDNVETFRITVKKNKNNNKFFCLSGLTFFDGNGDVIPLSEENLSTAYDHNTLNPGSPDGGGIPALFDGDNDTYFHSAWMNSPAGEHYLDVILPNGGYDTFSFQMLSRSNSNGWDQTHTFPGEMVISTTDAFLDDTKFVDAFNAQCSELASLAETYSTMHMIPAVSEKFFAVQEPAFALYETAAEAPVDTLIYYTALMQETAAYVKAMDAKYNEWKEVLYICYDTQDSDTIASADAAAAFAEVVDKHTGYQWSMPAATVEDFDALIAELNSARETFLASGIPGTPEEEPFDWAGTFTVKAGDVMVFNEAFNYPKEFEMEVQYYEEWDIYLVTKFFGNDVTALNNGGIVFSVSADDPNKAEMTTGRYLQTIEAGVSYLCLKDMNLTDSPLTLTRNEDGAITMSDFCISYMTYDVNMNQAYEAAAFYSGVTVEEGVAQVVPDGIVVDLSAADPTKCYSVTTMGRGGWTVDAAGTMLTCTNPEGLTVDESDPRQQFAILSLNSEDYYLYSVSAKKFVKRDGSLVAGVADAIEFVDASSMGAGRVMVRFDEDHIINVAGSYLVINTWNYLDAGNAVAIVETGDFDATEALAMLANSTTPETPETPEDSAKTSITINRSATPINGYCYIEGAYLNAESLMAFTSPLYRFQNKVETFRITVNSAANNRVFFCLSELVFFDIDGNKIELMEDNVTSNADHNSLNSYPDGGGIPALFDDDTNTYFHSTWQASSTDGGAHYLEVTLPNGGYDAFSFQMVARAPQNVGVYNQNYTFPGEMVLSTPDALLDNTWYVDAFNAQCSELASLAETYSTMHMIPAVSEKFFAVQEPAFALYESASEAPVDTLIYYTALMQETAAYVKAMDAKYNEWKEVLWACYDTQDNDTTASSHAAAAFAEVVDKHSAYQWSMPAATVEDFDALIAELNSARETFLEAEEVITPLEVVSVTPATGKVGQLDRVIITFNQRIQLSLDETWQTISREIKLYGTAGEEFTLTYNNASIPDGNDIEYIVNAEWTGYEYASTPITAAGSYTLNLSQIVVDYAGEEVVDEWGYPGIEWHATGRCEGICTWTIEEPKPILGDVNSDGQLTMGDVVMQVNAVLNIAQDNYNTALADMNGDGQITIVDVVSVVRRVLGYEPVAAARSMARETSAVAIETGDAVNSGNGEIILPIYMNDEAAYTAFQMDVVLPEGMSLTHATLGNRAKSSHSMAWSTLDNGAIRIVAYAMDNATFKDNAEALAYLTLKVEADDAALTLTDALFATVNGAEHRAEDVAWKAEDETTGVEALCGATRIGSTEGGIIIESVADTAVRVYTMAGQLVEQTVVKPGKTSIALPAGVYVVNGKKIIVK